MRSVLSACDTGIGEIRQGEGVYNLRRAFQEAGAKAVLSTLWQVNDEGTEIFMERFYKLILQGTSPQEALRKVQLSFIQDPILKHPLYWAPFVLIGEG